MTINITPETFGRIAAEGIRYGFDVSAYLVRRALNELPPPTGAARNTPAAPVALTPMAAAPVAAAPAPEPEPESVEDYLAGMRLR